MLAIFTGEDFKDVGGNPAGWLINGRDGTPMREPKRPVLAHVKVRRKNLLTPDQFPYTSPVWLVYDTGNFRATLDKAMAMAVMAGFAKRMAASKARGKLRCMELSTWIEACGIAPNHLVGILGARVGLYDAATVRVNATGNISVTVGAHRHGQGHETVFPQIVASKLGVPESSIEIVHGDASKIPVGMGSNGSRGLRGGDGQGHDLWRDRLLGLCPAQLTTRWRRWNRG